MKNGNKCNFCREEKTKGFKFHLSVVSDAVDSAAEMFIDSKYNKIIYDTCYDCGLEIASIIKEHAQRKVAVRVEGYHAHVGTVLKVKLTLWMRYLEWLHSMRSWGKGIKNYV